MAGVIPTDMTLDASGKRIPIPPRMDARSAYEARAQVQQALGDVAQDFARQAAMAACAPRPWRWDTGPSSTTRNKQRSGHSGRNRLQTCSRTARRLLRRRTKFVGSMGSSLRHRL